MLGKTPQFNFKNKFPDSILRTEVLKKKKPENPPVVINVEEREPFDPLEEEAEQERQRNLADMILKGQDGRTSDLGMGNKPANGAGNSPENYSDRVYPEYKGQNFGEPASEWAPKIISRLDKQINHHGQSRGENPEEAERETAPEDVKKESENTDEDFEKKVEKMYQEKTTPMDDIFPHNRDLNRHRE